MLPDQLPRAKHGPLFLGHHQGKMENVYVTVSGRWTLCHSPTLLQKRQIRQTLQFFSPLRDLLQLTFRLLMVNNPSTVFVFKSIMDLCVLLNDRCTVLPQAEHYSVGHLSGLSHLQWEGRIMPLDVVAMSLVTYF
jgi:hypothetical protein